jgi:hypothetical protein
VTYRDQVELLLAQIGEGMRELRLLKTYGVRSAALEERKRELARAREQLAAIVSG